ncbi:piggyBac transposable element-derived protein 2 [Trichonephila clavipes]|uniref:PiggyBac transposable element-derived protein 2 n=1 Tax=Trichonephila clavipes TaxID=2585209 RepID=A0A8X6RDY3_TRICX|nr:piggyBac transposable element-derived protein 2 [Trichonephila clavipes]
MIHFADNNEAKSQANDRAFKIRKLITEMNANFQKWGIFDKHLSIDEMMIRYDGHHYFKQYIKGKPISRGSHDFYFDVKNKITTVKWNDNKCDALATNFDIIEPLTSVSRREKGKSEKNKIDQPCLVSNYNKNMGGVDSDDWLLEKHTIKIRGKNGIDQFLSKF